MASAREDGHAPGNRVAQGALTNVARRAYATEVELRLKRADAQMVLIVGDDGLGLPPQVPRTSHGIRGMRERAMLIGPDSTSPDRRAAALRRSSPSR